ncbi:MAG: 2Fe-2S iron-sulfur cluster-binding protein [Chloroflexota bacterium]
MKTVSLIIDGRRVTAREGEKLLRVALRHGIYIPNLCSLPEDDGPEASCRLCFIEVAGKAKPVTACTEPAAEGMEVSTAGEKARRLARTTFGLLMASHPVDCGSCAVNGACELQRIARHLKVTLKPRHLKALLKGLPIDDSNPLFRYDPNKCVLCNRCVRVCRERAGNTVLGYAYRGFRRTVTTFAEEPIGADRCRDCGECVTACPAGAFTLKKAG